MVVQRETNLLFGILAVQLRLATPQQLVAAGALWAAEQQRELGAILVEQGVLTARDRGLIDELSARQVAAASGDASQVYNLYGGDSAMAQSFAGSLVFDRAGGSLKYESLRPSPRPSSAPPAGLGGELGDAEQLTTEHPGRYALKSEKGRGGVGRVLVAYDEHIHREIALKELLPESAASVAPADASPMRRSAALTARFLREARITGQLEHPGIVPVYELGRRSDGTVYYTMKLVRGQTLSDKLRASRGIADRLKLLPHYLDLCNAIAYAHSRGVIHRDIKPQNVMVGEFGETVLLDWGLAKVKGQADERAEQLADEVRLLKEAGGADTVEGKPIGTPSYMPPEQADGRIEDIDERSDVWSLGAVLYEILTGQPPFTGPTALEVIGEVLTDAVKPVREAFRDAPPELAAVAERCLQRDPQQRYQGVERLAGDVAAYTSGGLVSAYTYSATKILARWARKRRAAWTTAGVALVLLIAVGWTSYARVVQANAKLTRSNYALLASALVAKSANLVDVYYRWQVGTLLSLQAAKYENTYQGELTGETQTQLHYLASKIAYGSSVLRVVESGWGPYVAFSPDGKLLASWVDGDKTGVRLWRLDALDAKPIVLRHSSGVDGVAFSPNGKLLARNSCDGTMRLWRLDALSAEPTVLRGRGSYPVFSPDCKLLASAGADKTVRLWRLDALSAEPTVLRGCGSYPAFSPNGKLLASASEDGEVRLWRLDALSTEPAVLRGCGSPFAFSPDGKLLASVGSSYKDPVRLWRLDALSAEPNVLRGNEGDVLNVAFSPDGKRVASVSDDHTIRLWRLDALSAEPTVLRGHESTVSTQVAFSPDGKLLASTSDKTVRLWRLDALSAVPTVLRGHEDTVWFVTFSPDGKLLASTSDKTVRLWRLDALSTEPAVLRGHENEVWDVAFSPDGRLLASAGWDKTVRLWQLDALSAEPTVLRGHEDAVRCVAFSPDGKLLASASWDTVRIWRLDALSAEPTVLRGDGDDRDDVTEIAFSPDGELLALAGGTVRLWRLDALSVEPTVLGGREELGTQVAFSPDCRLLATASEDKTVRLWRLDALSAEPTVLRGHEGGVVQVAFSPDGKLLASASWDHTVRLWRLDALSAEPTVLRGLKIGGVHRMAFSPDGKLLAEVSGTDDDKTVRLWRCRSGDLVKLLQGECYRNLTLDEWNQYIGKDFPYQQTIPDLPPGLGAPSGPPAE